jgi:hypothetical protein
MSTQLPPLEIDTITVATITQLERRDSGRYPCTRQRFPKLMARPLQHGQEAYVSDFSMKGIGLRLQRRYEPGEILAIQLRSPSSVLSGILTAQVRHVTSLPDGSWHLGCSLSRRLTNREAMALL